jgi:hypothetical protein
VTKKLPAVRNDLSLVPLRVHTRFKGIDVGSATGFAYSTPDRSYLITNWHVVTGLHPDTRKPISVKTAAIPDELVVAVPFRQKEAGTTVVNVWWETWKVSLYKDVDYREPIWFEHPDHGPTVDVIAIPVKFQKENVAVISANDSARLKLNSPALYPPLNVYVLGYPLGIAGGLVLPIWKRATIANEPEFPLDGLPKIYIDTATRKGMSGAPVFVDAVGTWMEEKPDGKRVMQLTGRGRKFVGIYASRDGLTTEFEAQLGIVWKAEAIEQVIAGRKRGASPHWP